MSLVIKLAFAIIELAPFIIQLKQSLQSTLYLHLQASLVSNRCVCVCVVCVCVCVDAIPNTLSLLAFWESLKGRFPSLAKIAKGPYARYLSEK